MKSMNEYEMEIFEDYNDTLKNAPTFRIMRGIFNDEEHRKLFNSIACKIRDDVLELMNFINEDKGNINPEFFSRKINELPDEQKKSFSKESFAIKAVKTKGFLDKKNNYYKFTDWIKQVLLNLMYSNEIFGWVRYSRDSNKFNKGEFYYKLFVHYDRESDRKPKNTKLYYYTFLFIIDSLILLGIIKHKIGYIDHLNLDSKQSRMKFSQKGSELFSKIKGNIVFDELSKHDLIVKTDRYEDIIRKGDKKGMIKVFTKIINYKDSIKTRRKKEFIKKVNGLYEEQEFVVKSKDVIINNVSFLDDIYLYIVNNIITLKELDCEILDSTTEDNKYNTNIRYTGKLNYISNNISITINDKRSNINNNKWRNREVSLLIPEWKKSSDYKELYPQRKSKYKKGNDLLKINRIHFTINKKKMFRVYSRGS